MQHILDKIIETHRERYDETSEELAPIVMLIRNDEIEGVVIMTDGQGDWRDNMMTLPQIPGFDDMDGYILSCEGWLSSENGDSVETLIMSAFCKDNRVFGRVYEIIRREAGEVVELREMEQMRDKIIASTMNVYHYQTPPKAATVHG